MKSRATGFRPRHRASIRLVGAIALVGALQAAVPAPGRAAPLAQTALLPQASASGFPAGSPIFDSTNVGQGQSPTGTLTFSLFGPSDTSCTGPPLFTSNVAVKGNGYYSSASFTAMQAATYRWVVAYSGDANNAPVASKCGEASQAVTMGKRTPTLNATGSKVAATGTLSDTATLATGSGPAGPTGTITFSLYGPNNLICVGTPVFTSSKPVTGNGTYASDPFIATLPGTYRWVAQYSGDANNSAPQTICSDPAQAVDVASQVPRFVNNVYQDLLGRKPSVVETTLAVPLLEGGSDRTAYAISVANTPEFRQRTIESQYRTHLQRAVDAPALDAFLKLLADGSPIEVVPTLVLGSEEFYNRSGGTPGGFVDAMYRQVLGTTPDAATRDAVIDQLGRGADRFQLVQSLLYSTAGRAKLVDDTYGSLLNQPADASGRTFWIGHLNNGLRQEQLTGFVAGSLAYWLKS